MFVFVRGVIFLQKLFLKLSKNIFAGKKLDYLL